MTGTEGAAPARQPSCVVALVVTWSSGFIGAELGTRAGAAPLTLLGWRFTLLATALVLAAVASRARPPLVAGLAPPGCTRRAVSGGLPDLRLRGRQSRRARRRGGRLDRGAPAGAGGDGRRPLLGAALLGDDLGRHAARPRRSGHRGLGDLVATEAPWSTYLLPTRRHAVPGLRHGPRTTASAAERPVPHRHDAVGGHRGPADAARALGVGSGRPAPPTWTSGPPSSGS